VRVIYNLQDSVTLLDGGKIRLQPRNTPGEHVNITDEQANRTEVVAFSVHRRVNILTLEESAAYEAQRAHTAQTVAVEAPVIVPPEVPAPAPTPEPVAAPEVVVLPPPANEVTPEIAPSPLPTSEPEATGILTGEAEAAFDSTEKDPADGFKRKTRRR